MVLSPTSVSILQGEVGRFSCSMACSTHHTFTWILDQHSHKTIFTITSTERLLRLTGLEVDVKDVSTCTDEGLGEKRQSILVQSSLIPPSNFTLQCVAQPISPAYHDLLSNLASLQIHAATGTYASNMTTTPSNKCNKNYMAGIVVP